MNKIFCAIAASMSLASCGTTPTATTIPVPDFNFSGSWVGYANPTDSASITNYVTLALTENQGEITGTITVQKADNDAAFASMGTISGSTKDDTITLKAVITSEGRFPKKGCVFNLAGFGELKNDTLQVKAVFDKATCTFAEITPGFPRTPSDWPAAFFQRQ